eukprot:CAMPEP_0197652172 /NCGR_PEP_ID=MMETSP1338-20131121/34284_1 /TAXON_ID=43686 ORGANISM="Pelagodinium beii, Strain RCC1491" /NCGR_SAMPLE_ID=MMETSP1338 /ASSEMBLY_ACC=CAM_ASM_000754 /LENGTH=322 /DNA_ID=CAMNT_0043226983 /DNA_START=49 /DNA_END=1017 /DNA_ORIENTATION=-
MVVAGCGLPARPHQWQMRARRPTLLVAAGVALAALRCHVGTSLPFVSAPRSISLAQASSKDLPTASLTSVEQADNWMMMPLGVPKVAYRIPGAPNAEWVDIYNRMYRERIIFLGKEIDDKLANEIIGVLLYLDSEDNKKPIYLYINSPGGNVIAGLSIYDTMQHIKSPVITINVGVAASMASFLLAAGEKGKRIALPHSRIMIHQAVGGAQGQAEDIKVEAEQILTIHENIVRMYARMTGKDADTIREDLMRDNFMSAEEAKQYGLIDQVIQLNDGKDLATKAAANVEAGTSDSKESAAPAPPPEVPQQKPDEDSPGTDSKM